MSRRQKLETNLMPLDCWCRIIEYFEKVSDFLSVVYVVKNLLNHIKIIYPYCTNNITFSLNINDQRGILGHDPNSMSNLRRVENQAHVITLSIWEPEMWEYQTFNIENIMERISFIFRNLRTLNFDLPRHIFKENELCELRFLEKDYVFQNLRNLTMQSFPACGNIIMDLRNLSPFLEKFSLSASFQACFQKSQLVLTSSKRNKIKSLYLKGWILKNKILDFENLEELFLNNVVLIEKDRMFENLKKLSVLCLGDRSLSIGELGTLDKLRYLSLSKFIRLQGVIIRFSIGDFPSLEVLEIGKCRYMMDVMETSFFRGGVSTPNGRTMVISNLPSLRELIVEDASFPISLLRVQNIELFSISNCKDLSSRGVYGFKRIKNIFLSRTFLDSSFADSISQSLLSNDLKDTMEEFSCDIHMEDKFLRFDDFSSLNEIKTLSFVDSILNCPNLQEINIVASNTLKLRNLPKLKEILVDFNFDLLSVVNFIKHISQNSFHILDRIGLNRIGNIEVNSNLRIGSDFLNRCKELSISRSFSNLTIDGENLVSQDFQKLLILVHGKKLTLKNMPCKLVFGDGIKFSKDMELTNLDGIRTLRLNFEWRINHSSFEDNLLGSFSLDNLSNCKSLVVSDFIIFYKSFSIINTPIRKLVFRYLLLIQFGSFRRGIQSCSFFINENNFPHLEDLVIYDTDKTTPWTQKEDFVCHRESNIRFTKLKLGYLKNLKTISIRGRFHQFRKIFELDLITHPILNVVQIKSSLCFVSEGGCRLIPQKEDGFENHSRCYETTSLLDYFTRIQQNKRLRDEKFILWKRKKAKEHERKMKLISIEVRRIEEGHRILNDDLDDDDNNDNHEEEEDDNIGDGFEW